MAKHKHLVYDFDDCIVGLALPADANVTGAGNDIVAFGAGKIGSTTTTRHLTPFYSDKLAEVNEFGFLSPRAGTIRNLRVLHNAPAGNGNNITYTVRVGGSDTSVSVTMASTASSGFDVANTASVSAGQLISVKVTKALGIGSSPRNVMATFEFE